MAILRTGKPIGVVIHHSVYTPAKNMTELKAQAKLFNGWHKSKSWAEATKSEGLYPYISYHYLIALDGSLLNTTPEKYVKYHAGDNANGAKSFNLHGIGICITGNYENDKPTEAQMKTLVLLIRDIQERYDIDALVRGHKEVSLAGTACPGKNLGTSSSGWVKQVITNTNDKNFPAPVVEPKPSDCEERYDEAMKEIDGLRLTLGASQGERDMALDRITLLEESLKLREEELNESDTLMDIVKEQRDRYEVEKNEAIKELNSTSVSVVSIGILIAELFKRLIPKKQ